MFKRKKQIEKPIKKKKMFYDEIPIGSYIYCDYGLNRSHSEKVEKKRGKYERLEISFWSSQFGHGFKEEKIFDYYIDYNDILEYGLKFCIHNEIFTYIDTEWVEKQKRIEEAKSIKDLKDILKDIV